MSVVAAVRRSDGAVHIAWDSACDDLDGSIRGLMADKVFVLGDVAYGFAGDIAVYTALRSRASLPDAVPEDDVAEYVYHEVVPSIQEVLEDAEGDLDDDTKLGFSLLIVTRGRIFQMEGSKVCFEETRGYAAIGSGAPYVYGYFAAFSGGRGEPDPENAVLAVIHENVCPGLSAPVHSVIHR